MTDPVTARRKLAARLKELRVASGRTQQEVADHLQVSASKVIRIEKAEVGVAAADVRAMLDLFGVKDQELIRELTRSTRGSRSRQPFQEFSDALSPQTLRYLQYEATASHIRHVALTAVPGLLQTEDYTRALLAAYRTDEAKIDKVVESRHRRQETLARQDPPEIRFVLDEGLLHRLVGGAKTMLRQIEHIIDIAEHPNFTVLVLPFTAGAHAALPGPFVLLEFPNPDDPDVAFFENSLGNTFSLGDVEISTQYKQRFQDLERIASGDMLEKIASQLGSHQREL